MELSVQEVKSQAVSRPKGHHPREALHAELLVALAPLGTLAG